MLLLLRYFYHSALLFLAAAVFGCTLASEANDFCAADPSQPCLTCPHGPEACYKCDKSHVLINYTCQPKVTLNAFSYYELLNEDKG